MTPQQRWVERRGSSHNEEEESILLRASQIPSFDDHIRSYVASCQENDRA